MIVITLHVKRPPLTAASPHAHWLDERATEAKGAAVDKEQNDLL